MAKLRQARRPKAIPSSILSGDQGSDGNAPAASTKGLANKRPREDEPPTPRPGKRSRSAQPDEDDDGAAGDPTVLDLMNDFARSVHQPKKAPGEIMVALHSSRGIRARTRGASRAGPHEQTQLRTIEESPQPGEANVALAPAEQQDHDDSASEADEEAVEGVAHGAKSRLKTRERYVPGQQDSAEELFVQGTASRQRVSSPELHISTPEKMSRAAVTLYEFIGEDSPQKAPDKPVSRTQLQQKTTATRTRGPKRVAKPRVPADSMIRAEDDDFGYPPTSAQPSRSQPSNSFRRPPPKVAPRHVSKVPGSQATSRVGARAQRQAVLEAVEEGEEEEIVRESVEKSDDEVGIAHHGEEEQEDDSDDMHSQEDESEPDEILVEVISTEALQKVHAAMGKVGWSNKGKDWHKRLRVHSGAGGVPGHTRQCKQLFQLLYALNTQLTLAVKSTPHGSQNDWFEQNRTQVKDSLSRIGKMITKILEDYLAPFGDSDRRSNNNPDLRAATVADLTDYIVPLLVHTLWIICTLGDTDNVSGDTAVLAEEVSLTETALPYVRKVTNWVSRLYESLAREIKRCPPPFSSQKEKESAKTYRDRVAQQLYQWDENIQEAEDHLQNQKDRAKRLAQYAVEDQLLRERREKREEDEEEKTRRKMEAVTQSTRMIASQLRPWERKWQRATAGWHITEAVHTPSSIDINGRQRPVAAVQFSEVPVVVMHEPWPNEEKKWLLDQLRPADRNWRSKLEYWADVLERPVAEVAQEAELLRQTARILCVERGLQLEEWMKL